MTPEQLAQNVLDAKLLGVLQLVIVMFVLAIILLVAAILAMMYYNSQAITRMSQTQQNMSVANTKQQETHGKSLEAIGKQGDHLEEMVRAVEQGQRLQAEQTLAVRDTHKAVADHEEHTEQRYQLLIEGLKGVTVAQANQLEALKTDLTGDKERLLEDAADLIAVRIQAAVAPMLADLGTIRTSIEQTQARYLLDMEAIGGKVAETQHQILQAVNQVMEDVREEASKPQVAVVVGDSDRPVLAAAGDSGGSGRSDGGDTKIS